MNRQFHTVTLDLAARVSSAPQVQAQLEGERAFARWLRAHFAPAMLHPDTRIGFNREAALDEQLTAILRNTHAAEIAPLLRDLGRFIDAVYTPDTRLLGRLFGRPEWLQPACAFDEAQAALARAVPLITFTLPGNQSATLSVADIFERQDVQGRMAFFARDTAFMAHQARECVAALLITAWARARFGADAVAGLRQALSDQDDVRAALGLYGLADGAEDVSPIQEALARDVSKADIRVWYEANKERFRRVERVRARHIRVASEELASALAGRAAYGEDFAALACAYSLAADAPRGGTLGWVRSVVDPGWLEAIVLQQPVGIVSRPLRDPAGPDARWEIVLVERRIESWQPAGSETVRQLARKAIARERARSEFAAARARAFAAEQATR